MRTQRFGTTAIVVLLLLGFALPLTAQSDAVFLGSFSQPFTTFEVTGELTHPGQLDWYSFEVIDDDSTIFILSEGEDEEYGIRVLLFDSEDVYVDASKDGLLEATLAAGTFSATTGRRRLLPLWDIRKWLTGSKQCTSHCDQRIIKWRHHHRSLSLQ